MPSAPTIAPLGPDHAAAARDLTTAVGWSHRREDWLLALAVGRGLGAFDGDGALRGTLMWFPYGAAFGFVGMIAVDPARHRGGIGAALMARAIEDAGERALLLISTVAGRRLYDRLGFRAIGANAAHVGIADKGGPSDGVSPARPDDLPQLAALDGAALGYPRDALMAALAADGETAVVRGGETIEGFAICRRFGAGHVIGPVVAADPGQACRLIGWWLARRRGETVRIDVPAEHADLAAWLAARGLPRGGESPIMVRGAAPVSGTGVQRFALVSQAMG